MPNNIQNTSILLSSKYRLLPHILFWIGYLAFSGLVYSFGSGFGGSYNFIFVFIIDIITTYISVFWILQKYMVREREMLKSFLYLLLIILTNFILNFILQNFVFGDLCCGFIKCLGQQAYSLQFSLVFIVIAVGLKLFQLNYQNLKEINRLEKTKVLTELDFLKNQINPHFLFNTLNNIYIQTRIEPKKAADMVLKLSDLLRYQLYECTEDKVMLKSEVQYLKDYVALQQLRIANIDIKFEQKGSFSGLMLYPFMLIPFLENSFKYGVSSKDVENFIHIFVEIVGKNVIFAVKNSKNDTIVRYKKTEPKSIANIRRRLNLLYKDKYELNIENEENYFYVKLKINLE